MSVSKTTVHQGDSPKLRLVFMGTPEFAVANLRALVDDNQQVVAVVTSPDKPAGRGLQMVASPVKQYANSVGIPVLQPEKMRNPDFLAQLAALNADLFVVVAFRMLPQVVWAMPPRGTFNLHASLLPQYRGAAPINWAIINGETQTGCTTFFIEQEIDTGKIIFQETEPIHPNDTVGELYERLMHQGAALTVKTVRAIASGQYPQIPQTIVEIPRLAPKIFKETCQINWRQPAANIRNFVRGLAPYPAAWTTLGGKSCKIFETSIVIDDFPSENFKTVCEDPKIVTDHKKQLLVQTNDHWLSINDLQMEGKKRMKIDEFLRGFRF